MSYEDTRPRHIRRKVPNLDRTIYIQRSLNDAGFDSGPEDDIYGPITTAAVRRFQEYCRDHKNGPDPRVIDSGPVDGICGPLTKAALDRFFWAFPGFG